MQLKKYGLNLISVTALGIGSVVGAGILSVILPFFRQTGFCAERPNLRRQ